ncbi:MAG: hypothetical protein IH840_12615 [Candidatus Heimdallarchaeota archaeon]|nr:hypothetical protein [Candidatus Heimdallarchaeota archaeon]
MENNSVYFLGLLFLLIGDILWLGALFLPDQISAFLLLFWPDTELSDLNSKGQQVLRVMIGLWGSLLYLVGALFIGISKNYGSEGRRWILIGTLAWFIADSIMSFVGGFTYNVLVNIAFVLVVFSTIYFKGQVENSLQIR